MLVANFSLKICFRFSCTKPKCHSSSHSPYKHVTHV